MKKIFALIATLLMVTMLLTGCWKGTVKSDMGITKNGEGQKTITVEILKDHMPKPDGKGNVDDNSQFFKGGFEALNKWVKANAPAGYDVNVTDDKDKYIYTISYSFKTIDEYNEKTKKLIGDAKYKELSLSPATLTEEEAKNSEGKKGSKLTFKESKDVLYASVAWAIEGVFNNKELFDPDPHKTGAIGLTDIYEIKSIKVKVGDTEKEFDLTKDENSSLTDVELSGFVASPVNNTPLYIGIGAGAVVVIVVLALVIAKKKK